MAEVDSKPVGGATHLQVTDEKMDLFNYSSACEQDEEASACLRYNYFAKYSDQRVYYAAQVKEAGENEVPPQKRPEGAAGENTFWATAQQRMTAAYNTYKNLIGGLGEALKNGTYDPNQRVFKYLNKDIAVSCRADTEGNMTQLTIANPDYGILIDTSVKGVLTTFQGKVECKD